MATRVYPATKRPGFRYKNFYHGLWNPISVGPTNPWAIRPAVYEASTSKTNAGTKRDWYLACDHVHGGLYGSVCFGWFLPPFAAPGTMGGTFDLCFFVGARWKTFATQTLDAHAKWKVAITIIRPDSSKVDGVLDHEDSTDLFKSLSGGKWQSLDAPQALAAIDYEAGDRLFVEVGIKVTSIPGFSDTYPPSDAADIWFYGTGALSTDTDATAGGAVTTGFNGWLHFSQTLTFDTSDPPDNTTCALATVIPSGLPQTMDRIDTTAAPGTEREVFYQWTCPAEKLGNKVFFTAWGSNYLIDLAVFRGPCGSLVSAGALVKSGLVPHAIWTPVAGETYTIRCRNQTSSLQATMSGGSLEVKMFWRLEPAEGDLYVGGGPYVVAYRGNEGQLVNIGYYGGSIITGIGIDYSKQSLTDANGGTHDGDRMIVATHDSNAAGIYDLATLGWGSGEVAIDYFDETSFGIPFSPNLHPAQVSVLSDGQIYFGFFGNGYLHVEGNASTRTQAAYVTYFNAVPNTTARGAVRRTNVSKAVNQPNVGASVNIELTPEKYAPWVVCVDEANGILYFSTGSVYSYLDYSEDPSATSSANAARKVQRYNINTGVQMADIVVPGLTANGAFTGIRGIGLAPDGLLVAAGDVVILMSTAGALIRTYETGDALQGYDLVAVKLDPSGSFVFATEEMSLKVFKWEYATGNLVASWETDLFLNTTTQLEIFAHVCECCVSTQLSIENDALYKIGVSKSIVSLDENSRESITCDFHYQKALKMTLRRFPWAFATKYAYAADELDGYMNLVAQSEDDPAGGMGLKIPSDWHYAYRYPVDCVFARRIVPAKGMGESRDFDRSPIPFRVGMQWSADQNSNVKLIYTNEPDAVLEYTALLTCAEDFTDELFLNAVAWCLAWKIAPSMSRIKGMAQECFAQFENAIAIADTVDIKESQHRKDGDAEWTDER